MMEIGGLAGLRNYPGLIARRGAEKSFSKASSNISNIIEVS